MFLNQMPMLGSDCRGEAKKYPFPQKKYPSLESCIEAELPQRLCCQTREGTRLLFLGSVEDRPVTDSGPSGEVVGLEE